MVGSAATQMSRGLAGTSFEKLLAELELFSLEKGEDRLHPLPITSLFLAAAFPFWSLGLRRIIRGSH